MFLDNDLRKEIKLKVFDLLQTKWTRHEMILAFNTVTFISYLCFNACKKRACLTLYKTCTDPNSTGTV